MIRKIKTIFKSKDKKSLIQNFLALAIMQGSNYVLPLITIPYLIRVLHDDKFGLVMFAQAIIIYFVLLTEYAYNLPFIRKITLHRNNKNKINAIFSGVMTLKIVMLFISFILLALVVSLVPRFSSNREVYLISFGVLLGQTLLPAWFFQGIEKMKYITLLNLVAKTIATASIFIFIKGNEDYLLVPILNSAGFISSGIVGLGLVMIKEKVRYTLPPFRIVYKYIKQGFHLFLVNLCNQFYTSFNIIFLGFFASNALLGYYILAEKITGIFMGMIGIPINNAIYPYLTKMYQQSKAHYFRFSFKTLRLLFLSLLSIAIFVFVFADWIVRIIKGEANQEVVIILRILAFIIPLSPLGGLLNQMLVIQNKNKIALKVVVISTLFNLILALILVPGYGYIGTAYTVLFVQIIIIPTYIYYILNLKKNVEKLS